MTNPIADPFVEITDSDARSKLVVIDGSEDGVVTVTIDRAEKRNAFNAEVIGALREAFETLHAADGVRVVFVTGAGEDFSAGADLEWMKAAGGLTETDNHEDAMAMAIMLKHLHDLPCLTVALVRGRAMGGGAGLVTACDMAIATTDARFAFSEVKLGLIPATVSPYVVAAVGPRRARGLFASAMELDANRALSIGLVDDVVEDLDRLHAARDRIAAAVMACAPGATADAKRLVDAVAGRHLDHGLLEDTARRIARSRVSAEGREGVAAFLERRKPGWAI